MTCTQFLRAALAAILLVAMNAGAQTAPPPLAAFFANPDRPDTRAYRDYRHFLLETSQVVGGFYSARGRRALLRQVVDLMLAPEDPYQALTLGKAAPRQQLQLVR